MSAKVRKIDQPAGGRVETGVVQFGDDWPGIFIRGDNALAMAFQLKAVEHLSDLLISCHTHKIAEDAAKAKPKPVRQTP